MINTHTIEQSRYVYCMMAHYARTQSKIFAFAFVWYVCLSLCWKCPPSVLTLFVLSRIAFCTNRIHQFCQVTFLNANEVSYLCLFCRPIDLHHDVFKHQKSNRINNQFICIDLFIIPIHILLKFYDGTFAW